jgi:hypothetical protein
VTLSDSPPDPTLEREARKRRQSLLRGLRSVHIYASLLGFVLALFFGVTGFMLNHDEWFELEATRDVRAEGSLPTAALDPLDRLAVVEYLRAEHGVRGGLSSFEVDPGELRLRFARPGDETDVMIDRRDGAIRLERELSGLAATLTELHKGDRSGSLGGLLIDLAAILLVLISLSGFLLWISLPKRRKLGIAALVFALGLLGISALYLFA